MAGRPEAKSVIPGLPPIEEFARDMARIRREVREKLQALVSSGPTFCESSEVEGREI